MEIRSTLEMYLPGFRFHPTEEELLDFYLRRKVQGKRLQLEIIATVNLYRHDPWELPGLAKMGETEWYFYVPRDRRQTSGGRPSRTTERGFWKATGCDRPVRSAADPKRLIGLKKTLVFYEGRAPRGTKTDWVMNEYRLPDPSATSSDGPPKEENMVLCKIHRKATSMKVLEQRAAAMEEDTTMSQNSSSTAESASDYDQESFLKSMVKEDVVIVIEDATEEEVTTVVVVEEEKEEADVAAVSTRQRPSLPELEVPKKEGLEWLQDPFWTQLRSPWMDLWSPYLATMLNC
ncbi:unnamed protein product [Musa acuminata subsp. malaccensis]|uniref:(wild Malaysian banana) hypothetical protein n=1 Tax=Musa acuminata subsp. malaccensis TaxID=214687 RepID=A0A804ICC8_MUSAM|nr:PREDICTED: NAC domain-containing protein 35-like [Musa acuminata subsp. malaccensis]CAG1850211.1 unnamed protein product [Musa acuminata subsp. malaccensis]